MCEMVAGVEVDLRAIKQTEAGDRDHLSYAQVKQK